MDFGNNGITSAWTMLWDTSCSSGGWAQIGMAEHWHAYSEVFYEIEQCGGSVVGIKELGGTGTHHYKVEHNGHNPGVVSLWEDVTPVVGNTSVNWIPTDTADASETQAKDDQNYGDTNHQQPWSQFQQCDGTGCYSNASFCLFAGNISNPCSATQPWLDMTVQGLPAWATYDRDCST